MNSIMTVPCFYHPTTVIIVDDNMDFLNTMAKLLRRADPYIIVKTFTNASAALESVRSVEKLPLTLSPALSSDNYLPASNKAPLEFDISKIYQQATHPEIFQEISVAVVDYDMDMPTTGADFCTEIQQTPIKKIMLTGEADSDLGVALLNNGVINKFLVKTQRDLEEKLATYIVEMKKAYFQDLSSSLLNNLSPDMGLCLADPAFVKFFNDTCQERTITSYYLIDFSGSFLLMDANGKLFWLIVKTKTDVEEYVDFIQDAGVDKSIVQKIADGKEIPYFYQQKDYLHSIDTGFPLEKYLYPAKKLSGKTEYYYCITDRVHDFPLEEGCAFKR